jgi:hypothetical protein
MPTPTDEASLPQAVDELYRAVAALVDHRKQFINGRVLAGPSMYESLLGEVPAKSSGDTFTRGVGRSIPCVFVDAVDLRAGIDGRVKSWQPRGDSTPARLRALASRRWRPQDAALVRRYATETQAWVSAIGNLIDPPHVKDVGAPCPACGRRWFYRSRDGEDIRQPALQLVIETGCTCQACGAHYTPDRYLWLCKLLGFEVPAGVLE